MRNRLLIGCAVLLYILTRFYLFIQTDTEAPQSGDAGHYYIIAQNLASHNIYADSPIKNQTNTDLATSPPTAAASATWRPPLWPFVLSVWMEFTSNPNWQMLLKLVFEGLLLGIVYLMLQSMELPTVIPGVVLCLLAIEPHYIKYSLTFLSENLTALLLVLMTGSFLYTVMANSRRATWCCAVFGGVAILSHPVVLPFVFLMVLVSIVHMFKIKRRQVAFFSFLLFSLVVLSWPLRNQLIFCQGLFMTASQGAVFSKGWNDEVLAKHTNTQGDLLDEGLNLSRYPDLLSRFDADPIQNSSIMQEATLRYMGETDLHLLVKMALWKWYCGINPIPQTLKPGLLEAMGTIFRVFYLVGLVLGVYALVTNKFESNTLPYWSALILVLVFSAISIISVGLYTGLRFNSVYAPVNLVMTLFVILGLWKSNSKKDLTILSVAK
ncbi:MAG: hypothetical protein ACK560_03455 [Bacteroidota bacterium]